MITVKIDNRDVKFSCSAIFAFNYKKVFKQDVLKVIMPMIKAIVPLTEVIKEDGNGQSEIGISGIVSLLPQVLDNAEDIELLDVYKILYALALTADKNIGDFESWLGSFEKFPIFDVVGKVFPDLLNSLSTTIESKKKKQSPMKK
ncbi:hypothetical protein [Miniphocaeibacter massiliensis]|uniref:hypothetical protein n=1 Tax=Miniphocaeibacter massiliensis TaxID=2041841 RepID=UPI000C1BC3D7|nr:hypothetical protein [Miniphocaeibacter massiliensis]